MMPLAAFPLPNSPSVGILAAVSLSSIAIPVQFPFDAWWMLLRSTMPVDCAFYTCHILILH